MSLQIAKHSFTAAEFERMGEAGIFSEDARLELIEGEIVEISPIGSRHAACVDALAELFREKLQRLAIVRVQSPIQLDVYSQPQPDIALLTRRDDYYRQAHPGPADVLLVVEVADTTVEYDRQIKLPFYARAGIAEVWLVNLVKDQLEIHAGAAGGAYLSSRIFGRGETAQSQTINSLKISVDEVLG